jgi:putative inorganic carbon (HCO3(-)) transporter
MLRGLFLRAVVAVGVPLALVWPFGGVLVYLWYSHARPNDFVWPSYSFTRGAYILAAATLIGYLLFEIRRSPPRIRGLALVPLFYFWTVLACLFAGNPALAEPKIWEFGKIFVITFLVAAMANSEGRVRTLLYALGISVGILGLKGAIDFIITGGQARMMGPGGVEGEENEYALALNVVIPILFGLARSQPRVWGRWLLKGMALGCAITVIGTHSRSGFLGLALAALLLTLYSKRRLLGVVVLALCVVAFLKYAPSAAMSRYQTIPNAADDDASAIGRLQAWETALLMMKAHPFFGIGPLQFEINFPKYTSFRPRACHNAFLDLGAESGIPSCLLFVAILGGTIFTMWRLRRRLGRFPGNEDWMIYCLMIQQSIMVYIVPNMFISRQNEDLMWHLVGVSAGLAALVRRRLATQYQQGVREEQEAEAQLPEPVNA